MFWPVINDITTTYPHEPQFVEIRELNPKQDYSYPAHFFPQQTKAYPEVKPLLLKGEREPLFAWLEDRARQQERWSLVLVDPVAGRIEAVAVTRLLRFKDDVVIELRSVSDFEHEVHMRSRSRLGRSDLGANAQRILSFLEQLRQATATSKAHSQATATATEEHSP